MGDTPLILHYEFWDFSSNEPANTDHKGELSLRRNIEAARGASLIGKSVEIEEHTTCFRRTMSRSCERYSFTYFSARLKMVRCLVVRAYNGETRIFSKKTLASATALALAATRAVSLRLRRLRTDSGTPAFFSTAAAGFAAGFAAAAAAGAAALGAAAAAGLDLLQRIA